MSKMLARLKIQSDSPDVLGALAQSVRTSYDASPERLDQNHYQVEGSFEEHTGNVNIAFRKWCDDNEAASVRDWSWWYCTTLAIFTDHIIFYCYRGSGEYNYYKLAYSAGENGVAFNGDPQEVEVKMVVQAEAKPIIQSTTEREIVEIQMENTNGTPIQAQDTVTDDTVVETASPVEHSDSNPTVKATATDANTPGASMPSPNEDAAANRGVEHSDDNGAGPVPSGDSGDAVAAELARTASGLKGESSDPGMNVNVNQDAPTNIVGNDKYLLQNVGVGQDGMSFCQILKQTVTEDGGKKTLHIEGIATRAEIVSKAGKVYPREVWAQNLVTMNEAAQAGKFIGKLEHPDQEQGLIDTAIRFESFEMQGDDVHFKAVVLGTEGGKELQALIDGGVAIDMSSRGYGSAKKQSWRGKMVEVIQDDFVCVAFDAVHYGASTGSQITTAEYQSAQSHQEGEIIVETPTLTPQEQAQAKATALRDQVQFKQTKADLLATAGLTTLGASAYQQALDKCEDLVTLIQTSESILPILQSTFATSATEATEQAQTWSPTFMVKQSAEDRAPKTVGELFDRLVADLPETYEGQSAPMGDPTKNHFAGPRAACKRLMINMAQSVEGPFNGRAAALGLLALEQGHTERAQDILTQSLATGATTAASNADGGGAPLSAPLIFPLVRRVFPMYIMQEIAAIQPMDRPEGKIFYMDAYRTEDPAGQEKRIDLNTSASPFNSSYADNPTEGAAAQLIRLRLASVTIDAHTKKLGAAWSIEEMQDLRAYHGLDAGQELMGSVAREMALEWNKEVLDDMLAQASAAALTFGTTAPGSGFPNQKDWDEYLWVYLQNLDNKIFSKRNGPMTHLVAGVDAALALSKSMRGTFTIGGDNGGQMDGPYPGTTFYGSIRTPNGSAYKIFKTNFWGSGTANGSKILGLRRGTEWSDTPYVWAPYTDYITPTFTDPADFSQKQGIVSRAGKKVVVSDAMGYITINSSTGVVL